MDHIVVHDYLTFVATRHEMGDKCVVEFVSPTGYRLFFHGACATGAARRMLQCKSRWAMRLHKDPSQVECSYSCADYDCGARLDKSPIRRVSMP